MHLSMVLSLQYPLDHAEWVYIALAPDDLDDGNYERQDNALSLISS